MSDEMLDTLYVDQEIKALTENAHIEDRFEQLISLAKPSKR